MQDTSFWRWLFSAIRLTIAALCVLATMAVIRWLVVTRGPGFDLKPLTTPDLISIAAGAIALAAFLVAFWFNRGARADGARLEKSNAYLNLEIASRSEKHTSEFQSLIRSSYAVFCWKHKTTSVIYYTEY